MTQTSAERTGIVVVPDISVVAGSGSADLEATTTGTAALPDTSAAAGSGAAGLEATLTGIAPVPDISVAAPCSGIPVPQCVPQSDLQSRSRMGQRQPLIPHLGGTNSERLSKLARTDRLPDGSDTERPGDDPDHGPRSLFL